MPATNQNDGLKRVVGVSGLTFSIVNAVIGSGIFVLPAIVGIALGGFGVFGYIVCSIMLAAIMFCYAEIGSKVTGSGGSYAYVEAAFGEFAGFTVNWFYFFGWGLLGSAAVLNILADSLAVMFPALADPLVRGFFFFALIGLITLINISGARQGIGLVIGITIIKVLPLICIIIFGIGRMNTGNLHWEHLPSLNTFGNTTLLLFYAFAGFENSLGMSGELKNPKRTVPLGIFLGGIIVLLVYMLLQMVTQGMLGDAVSLYKNAPLAAVAEKMIGPAGTTLLIVTAAISCFGNVHADVMATPRALFAGARDGTFPKYLAKVHPKFATPYLAIITYGVLIFIFAISGGFKQLAILASGAILLIYLAVVLATVKLRMNRQDAADGTFRMPGGYTIPVIAIASIGWLLTGLTKWEMISALIFTGVIALMYFAIRWWKPENKTINDPAEIH
jgi:basic amino acid/polyamine antiporter, APA family